MTARSPRVCFTASYSGVRSSLLCLLSLRHGLAGSEIGTGTRLFAVESFPSAPPAPQQRTIESLSSEHVWSSPALIAVTPEDSPTTSTGTALSIVELFPSWPVQFSPQQRTPPFTKAHACERPTAIAVMPDVSPETCIGTRLLNVD